MNGLDLLTIVIIGFFTLRGFARGLIKELFTTFGLVLGIYIAVRFTSQIAAYVSKYVPNPGVAKIIGFVVIFVFFYFLLSFIGDTIAKITKFLMLEFIDRILGAALGLLEGFFIAGAFLFVLFQFSAPGKRVINNSGIALYVFTRFHDSFGKIYDMQEEKLKKKFEEMYKGPIDKKKKEAIKNKGL